MRVASPLLEAFVSDEAVPECHLVADDIPTSNKSLTDKYYARLQLDPSTLDNGPTLKKLQSIIEAHLMHVPFENIAQHGATGGVQTTDLQRIASRVLDQHRGGFCLELNALLAHWLHTELGYPIKMIMAVVGMKNDDNDDIHFNSPALHLLALCSTMDDNFQQQYIVDVAFGEPPVQPLKYVFDIDQETPEGMISKLTLDTGIDTVTMHWFRNDQWIPRLQWKYSNNSNNEENETHHLFRKFTMPSEWDHAMKMVQDPMSIFTKKMIVTKVTRTHKYTLAGTKLKVTSEPRFGSNDEEKSNVTVQVLMTDDEVRSVLFNIFGIPFKETIDMDFTNSKTADPTIWEFM